MKIRAAVSPSINQLKTRTAFFAGAVAAAMGMMLVAPAATAQNEASQATIPFAFSVNHQVFPAGHYRVAMDGQNEIRLVSYDTGDSAAVVVHTTRSVAASPKSSLVFLHDEQGYELTSVRFGQGGVLTEAGLQSRAERALTSGMRFTRTSISTR
jgi:hypothetical protein